MIIQVLLEGLLLGVLLILVCAFGIRKGAVGMVHLYGPAVQTRCIELGLTTQESIRRNSRLFKPVLHSGLSRLHSRLRLCHKRHTRICRRVLADARHSVGDECDGSLPRR